MVVDLKEFLKYHLTLKLILIIGTWNLGLLYCVSQNFIEVFFRQVYIKGINNLDLLKISVQIRDIILPKKVLSKLPNSSCFLAQNLPIKIAQQLSNLKQIRSKTL